MENDSEQSGNSNTEDDSEAREPSHPEDGSPVQTFPGSSSSRPSEVKEIFQSAWESGINHKQMTGLLKILRKRLIPDLPKTAATFFGTSKASYDIREM